MRLIPREEKFFTYFGEQTALISKAAKLLHESVRQGNSSLKAAAEELNRLEGQGDEIIHEIYKKLNQTFITPLDPEDIHSLASHLDDVLDALEESAHRMVAYRIEPIPPAVVEFCALIEACALELEKAFDGLRTQKRLLEHCIEINQLEEKADQLARRVIADLFDHEQNPLMVMKLKEIYDLLELTTDNFEDVADALQNVEVKNS
jgi:predicted phosphate transport protein (TIGR00153 family)